MSLLRVFPRRTKGTPVDDHAFVGFPPLECFIPQDVDAIHVSVTFSWDLNDAERMAYAWKQLRIAPVSVGGPVFEKAVPNWDRAIPVFEPGKYLRKGYTITSRGCPNRCWFCEVSRREGDLVELPVAPGSNLLDNNILACSEAHIREVFEMLSTQSHVVLSGGIEARRLKPWHMELFEKAKVAEAFFAYDEPNDLPPLEEAARIIKQSPWYRDYKARCYVLVGYPGDTLATAETRLITALRLGFYPFAMYYRDPQSMSQRVRKPSDWQKLVKMWSRPAIINSIKRKYL